MANIGEPQRIWEIVPDEEPIRRQQPSEDPLYVEEPDHEEEKVPVRR